MPPVAMTAIRLPVLQPWGNAAAVAVGVDEALHFNHRFRPAKQMLALQRGTMESPRRAPPRSLPFCAISRHLGKLVARRRSRRACSGFVRDFGDHATLPIPRPLA